MRRGISRGLRLGAAIAALAAGACGGESRPPEPAAGGQPAVERQAAAEGASSARLGEGFLVWESNRSGRWRLWIRPLDEDAPRQLTPEEGERRHCCPHVAPGGGRIAYLSLPASDRPTYGEEGDAGVLRLIAPDGGGDRVISERARTYFENRAAVWRDERRLVAIDGDGRTVEVDVDGGDRRELTRAPLPRDGWLLNATLTHGSTGWATFSPYDAARHTIEERARLGGCQPYFSHDGRWGFWMAGAGGPIHRIELASREVSTLLRKNDPSLPGDRGYLYFPMLSRDGGLLAFAASRGEHDHFTGDYDLFVVETDPQTLEPIGRPLRMTRDPAVDRFPDLYRAPLPLGRRYGEAPYRARFEAGEPSPPGGSWRWSFGDGGTAAGASVEHLFERAGTWPVRAVAGEIELAGLVTVRPAAPPRAVGVELRDRGAELVVRFDEPVDATAARLELASGLALGAPVEGDGGRTIAVRPAERLTRPDRLTLTGIRDRAQRPNTMEPAILEVEPPLWPARREALLFLWESAGAPNLVPGADGGVDRVALLRPRGRGRFDRHGAMVVDGGGFETPPGEGERLVAALKAANEVTLEATVEAWAPTGALETIVALVGERRGADWVLAQRGDRLLLRLRVGPGGREGLPTVELGALPIGRPAHLVVVYSPGRLAAYLDGEPLHAATGVRGDLYHWQSDRLVVGVPAGDGGWRGTVSGLALYGREMGAAEARENAVRRAAALARRPPVERLRVEATPVRRSPPPSLEEISPYREALAVSEYRITGTLEGSAPGPVLRVAEWVLLDGSPVPRADGPTVLTLEPFADQPQLESIFVADRLEPADSPLFYAVGR